MDIVGSVHPPSSKGHIYIGNYRLLL